MEHTFVLPFEPRAPTDISKYLGEKGIVETDRGFLVAQGIGREDAVARLCDLAGDMMMEFDVQPSPTVPTNEGTDYHFANQYGIFYITNCSE